MNMSWLRFGWVSVFAMSVLLGVGGRAESATEGVGGSSRFASRHANPGKKPYPAGTRAQWIEEGRVLGEAPEGSFPRNKALKGAADNRANLPPVGDQGSEGSCVHWAGTYYCKTANMKRLSPSLNTTAASNQCSPRFTYNLSNAGSDGGGYGHEPFEIFMRYGVASLQQKPYVEGQYATLPTVADFVEGLHRRTTNYVWLWEWDATPSQITELKAFLDAGGVAVAGVNSSQSSFENWSAGDDPWVGATCTEDDIDHMVAVCGYGSGFYILVNSWGTGFGDNGFMRVDSTYFENNFSDVMYPLEGAYTPVTSYAKLQIDHARRSDLRSLLFSVNGSTVWSNSPLPKNLPKGTGAFDEDSRGGWQLAVDLSEVSWSGTCVVTARCADRVVGTMGQMTNFTVRYNGTNFVSGSTPISIPDNSAVGAAASVSFTAGPLAWDNGYTDLGGGWRRLAWFGDYAVMGSGWIWHNKHGFLFAAASATPTDIWFYANDMGWLWTGNATYPYLYRSSPSAWLWYNGSSSPRWFRNMTANTWESWP